MSPRPIIDVTELPHSAMDHRSAIWWGNAVLVLIETVMFVLLLAAYFYVRPNFTDWPPPKVYGPTAINDPVPALGWPLANLALILFSFLPVFWADRAALHRNEAAVKVGLIIAILAGVGIALLRFPEFEALRFRWDDNAYGSIIWTLLGLHLFHVIIGTLENVMMLAWILARGMDDKHARDVRVAAVYWYWIILTWIVVFAVVFLEPRFGGASP
jgi:cytochrome c oxidase subunit 3